MAPISRTIRKKKKPWRGAGNSEALLLMSDEDLIEQFQAGTVEAFNILVDRYSERLMHYLYGFLGDTGRSQDLLQETFLRVYRNRHSYHSMIKFFSVDFLYFFVNPIFATLWNIDLLPPILEKRATS